MKGKSDYRCYGFAFRSALLLTEGQYLSDFASAKARQSYSQLISQKTTCMGKSGGTSTHQPK